VRQLRLAEVLGSLSYGLDLTEGQPAGHVLRACLIGMAVGERAGLECRQLTDLYHALLLKDIGCTANSSRTTALLGADDRWVKRALKLTDLSRRGERARWALGVIGRDERPVARMRRIVGIARGSGVHESLIRLRCERGAELAADLGYPQPVSDAIRSLDEHWDGGGYPDGLAAEAIPRASRILLLAQTVDVFATARGADEALAVARRRSGQWFDPALVPLLDRELLEQIPATDEELMAAVADVNPTSEDPATDAHLTQVAHAFAEVVDTKSPWTARHSHRVAAFATAMAERTGHPAGRDLVRAALLHDIGTLGVSNRILDKPGSLTARDWLEVRGHAVTGAELLERTPPFRALAPAARDHHERLDGSGYPRGLKGEEISAEARLLAVADAFESLTAGRPYRPPIAPAAAVERLRQDAGTRLDADCVEALAAFVAETPD
jgi:putative nucleotidyltransferase with HDIG domain